MFQAIGWGVDGKESTNTEGYTLIRGICQCLIKNLAAPQVAATIKIWIHPRACSTESG
jgi:hypothetical protein